MPTTDTHGRTWALPENELCPTCGQPDNCGDCDHTDIGDDGARELGADPKVHVIIVSFGLIPEVSGVFFREEDARKHFVKACRDAALYSSDLFPVLNTEAAPEGKNYYRYVEPMVDGHMTKEFVDQDEVERTIDKVLEWWEARDADYVTDDFVSDGDDWEIRWQTETIQ